MHNPKATANALALVGAGSYVICAVWVMVARDSFMGVFTTWTHSVNLAALPAKIPDVGSVITGLITFTLAAWVAGYAFAVAYNYYNKKSK